MSAVKSRGFTIIEVLLFLAISGLMMVTMITGTSLALNTQRYHDAVRSLKDLIQLQYSKLDSTENERSVSYRCGNDGLAVPEEVDGSAERAGQSKCEIFGRYMLIRDGNVTIYPLLVRRNESAKPASGTDIALMSDKNYFTIGVDTNSADTDTLEWGARIAWPRAGNGAQAQTTPRNISIIFVRSPDSGQVYTFSGNDVPADTTAIKGDFIRGMIVAGDTIPGQGQRTLCVDSGGLMSSSDMFVFINSYANGPSAIETRTNDYNGSIGSTTQC